MNQINISYFTSARDNAPKPLEATWSDINDLLASVRETACTPETCKRKDCEFKHGPAWSPASYPVGAGRARNSVVAVSALVLDVDHIVTDEEVADIIDRIPYQKIVHGSHSDKPGDRCIRIVVALSRPVPGAQWPDFWTNVIKALRVPVDQATKDASRLYFLPSRPQGAHTTEFGDGTDYLYAESEGPSIDVDDYLDASIEGPDTPHVGVTPTIPEPSDKKGRDRALEVLAAAWPEQGRHQASLALAGALAHAQWDADTIARFMHDLMALVYPSGDPSVRKREDQARDSVSKFQQGQAVSGWPSLAQYVGELASQETQRALGIGARPKWVEDILAKRADIKPTNDQIRTHYKQLRTKFLRQRTNPEKQYHAVLLGKVLDFEQPSDSTDEQIQALADTLKCLVRYALPNTEDTQIAQLLLHVFPVDVGQDEDASWSETLVALVEQTHETLRTEAENEGEFDTEVSGQRMGKPKQNLQNLDVALRKLKVKLRFDEFACKKQISIDGTPWEIVQDRHTKGLWLDIERKWDLNFSIEKWAAYLDQQAYRNAFHPVRDYLDTLEWDGVPRIDTWLHTYGGAADNEYARAVSRLILIAAVRRVREPGCKFDEMLILEGEQGVQKSSALQALCPDNAWFSDNLPLGSDSKQVIENTGGKWIIEAGELGGMSKKSVGDLKAFLSRCVDEARMAFGREVHRALRQFIVIGTTNDAQYLKDPTGLRRFWPVLVVGFDVARIIADRDQLWAEAAHYEAQGESIRLNPAYYGLAAQEQEERRVVDTIEAIIDEAFSGHNGKVRVVDVYQLLGKDAAEVRPDEQTRVGEAMRRAGWKHTRRRINSKPTYVYVKGSKEEQEIALGVSGRKVVRLAGQGVLLDRLQPQPKVN